MRSGLSVFDSWAIIEWLFEEPAAPVVHEMLQLASRSEDHQILMSWINVGEVYYMAVRKRNRNVAEGFLRKLPSLPIEVIQPGPQDFIDAARLKATRRISYADAFAAVLAQDRGATVVTGDPEFRALFLSNGSARPYISTPQPLIKCDFARCLTSTAFGPDSAKNHLC